MRHLLAALFALAAVGGGIALAQEASDPPAPAPAPPPSVPTAPEDTTVPETPAEPKPRIAWRRSVAVGQPWAGRLVRGVRLPARGPGFLTWDPVLKRSPDRAWRRWGTDRLVRLILRAIESYESAHPEAPPVLVGDLSRPHGGDFGPRFGSIGHMTHQNGRDVDVYYPRRDRRALSARRVDQVDPRLAQALVSSFVAAGAKTVLIGPHTGLRGPRGRVKPWPNHDDHLHVRIRPVRQAGR